MRNRYRGGTGERCDAPQGCAFKPSDEIAIVCGSDARRAMRHERQKLAHRNLVPQVHGQDTVRMAH